MKYSENELDLWAEIRDDKTIEEMVGELPAFAAVDMEQFNANLQKKNTHNYLGYFKVARLMQSIRRNLEAGGVVSGKVDAFLIENLTWNIPDSMFIGSSSWNKLIRNSFNYVRKSVASGELESWKDVSQSVVLFGENKYQLADVEEFINQAWAYMSCDEVKK